jgi:hypothetical protein
MALPRWTGREARAPAPAERRAGLRTSRGKDTAPMRAAMAEKLSQRLNTESQRGGPEAPVSRPRGAWAAG